MKQAGHKNVITKSESRRAHVSRALTPASLHWLVLSLWARYFSVVVMLLFVLFGNVYARGVGAIVCWWRLEIHSRVPGECHCRSSPQLAIVGPGAVTGWELFPTWLVVLCVKIPLPAPDRGKREEWGDLSPISAQSCPSHYLHLGPFCLGNVLLYV